VAPSVCDFSYQGLASNDSAIFFNFRPDRARQLTRALTQQPFEHFERPQHPANFYFACLTLYDETFNLPVAYPKQRMDRLLAEVLSEQGLTQFRTAETEKYAHVTFFFNGGFEPPYPGEVRQLIPSPTVATYDLQPEMHIQQVTNVVCEAVASGQYDFIVVNFANPDMVGHTGNLPAAEQAVMAVDKAIKQVTETVLSHNGTLLLTADHGNCEVMIDADGNPHTAHTTNLVPLVLVSDNPNFVLDSAPDIQHNLSEIAPTILDLLGIAQPPEMTSQSLLVYQANTTNAETSPQGSLLPGGRLRTGN
jgi:2,3-bisphosphoglycerate-independent phosphoglycerate mutase